MKAKAKARHEAKPKVTIYQAQVLRAMAITRSPLVKTFDGKYGKVTWGLANGREVTDACARALIRNGWVIAQRDGMYDVAQSYVLRPIPKGAFS
jgi:hypothetical protein